MRRFVALLAVVALVVSVAACAMPYGAPVYGGLFTNAVKGPVTGVDNNVGHSKTGTATAQAIVFFATGDASISAAMANGGINKVHHVDCETFSILGVYATYVTRVYGE